MITIDVTNAGFHVILFLRKLIGKYHMMDQEMRKKLKALLIKHEGYAEKIYFDSRGNPSIGIGRNLKGRGALPDEIELMFNNDIDYFYNELKQFKWFNEINEARQVALIDICFSGINTFLSFTKMIDALSAKCFNSAANEILESKYAKQVGERANDIAKIIVTGELE